MLHACLYTICFVFCYTLWHFSAFSRTNLLTRRHSASSLFSAIFLFQKSYRKYSRNWTKQKPNLLFFQNMSPSPKQRWRGARTWPHPRVARAKPLPRHQGVSPPGPLPDAALSPIYSPRWEKPKDPINFLQNLLQAAAIINARSGGSRSSSRHPAGEGNYRQRPYSSPWSPLE
jgi:hypothetical protein